jgi:hypothetical protein
MRHYDLVYWKRAALTSRRIPRKHCRYTSTKARAHAHKLTDVVRPTLRLPQGPGRLGSQEEQRCVGLKRYTIPKML